MRVTEIPSHAFGGAWDIVSPSQRPADSDGIQRRHLRGGCIGSRLIRAL